MRQLLVFPLVFVLMSIGVAVFARAVLLPLGLRLQRRYGWSNEFVTELSVGAPLVILVVSFAGWVAWLWQ